MNVARGAVSAGRMRAWRVHAYSAGTEELRLESARVPPLRAPDQLLVRVHTASINPLDVAMLGTTLSPTPSPGLTCRHLNLLGSYPSPQADTVLGY